jgi:four helix bundle protein
MRDFTQLEFWSRSHLLTLSIYKITNNFPKEELFGLTSQMRRSAASIPTNIAEGCGRSSPLDTKRFFAIASGSISELQYQLLLCKDLVYINNLQFKELSKELTSIRKMIYRYSQKLNSNS